MAKVITFSRYFPKTHPRSGEPTYFVEQILNQMKVNYKSDEYLTKLIVLNQENIVKEKLLVQDLIDFQNSLAYDIDGLKHHTIRNGHRFKQGESFSPRVWSKSAYNSPQIIFLPDTEVKKTFPINIDSTFSDFEYCQTKIYVIRTIKDSLFNQFVKTKSGIQFFNGNISGDYKRLISDFEVYKKDGLSLEDFIDWFIPSRKCKKIVMNHYFEGQIICWSDDVNY